MLRFLKPQMLLIPIVDCYRDVSGVELLMNNHRSLKAEVDAREENFTICIDLGKDLLDRKHYRSDEVSQMARLHSMICQIFWAKNCTKPLRKTNLLNDLE